jgi:endonuclease-3
MVRGSRRHAFCFFKEIGQAASQANQNSMPDGLLKNFLYAELLERNKRSAMGVAKSSTEKRGNAPNSNEAFVLEMHARLSDVYGRQIRYFHDLDPLSELVSAMLSHRTKNKQSGQAFKNLIGAFSTWEAVRDADTKAVETAIAPCTWPEQKAPRIQDVLRRIGEARGELSLEFLRTMAPAEARAWLEQLPGVGPKTSAAVLQFSNLRGKALPVDSHHFRVAVRLGIINEWIGEAKANRVLEALLPPSFSAQEMYDHHQVMMRHGQNICTHYRPQCAACVLLDRCPTGQVNMLPKT